MKTLYNEMDKPNYKLISPNSTLNNDYEIRYAYLKYEKHIFIKDKCGERHYVYDKSGKLLHNKGGSNMQNNEPNKVKENADNKSFFEKLNELQKEFNKINRLNNIKDRRIKRDY